MASEWYYLLSDEEVGPVEWSELVRLVRDGSLSGSDRVRREAPSDWQRADSVIGLFRAARHSRPTGATGEEARNPSPVPDDAVVRTSRLGEWTAWFPGVRRPCGPGTAGSVARSSHGPSVRQRPTARHAGFAAEPPACPSAETSTDWISPDTVGAWTGIDAESADGDRWSEAVAAALAAADARRAAGRPARIRRWSLGVEGPALRRLRTPLRLIGAIVSTLSRIVIGTGRRSERVAEYLSAVERRLPSRALLRTGFRCGAALVAANVVGLGVLGWSEREALRFPPRGGSAASVFPLVGECGRTEYLLLVAHAVIFSAAAAYAVAVWLESRAEE